MTDTPFKLTREDIHTALWKRLAAHLTGEIDYLRGQLESTSMDIKDTTVKRGEIRFAKRILALADEAGQEARQTEGSPEPAFVPPHGG